MTCPQNRASNLLEEWDIGPENVLVEEVGDIMPGLVAAQAILSELMARRSWTSGRWRRRYLGGFGGYETGWDAVGPLIGVAGVAVLRWRF